MLTRSFLLVLIGAVLAVSARGQEPPVIFRLGDRHGHAAPHRAGCTHLGGGNIDVEQPEPNEVVITMMGAAVATGHPFQASRASMVFDLDQDLRVVFREPEKVKAAKLSMEVRVIGLLRSQRPCHQGQACGTASCGCAQAVLTCGEAVLLEVCAPPHQVACGENLSVNCQNAPLPIPIQPGCYHLHQTFTIGAAHPRTPLPCRPASAEFAADALNEKWVGYWEPFHGAKKKKFGFQLRLRLEPEEVETLPPPRPSK